MGVALGYLHLLQVGEICCYFIQNISLMQIYFTSLRRGIFIMRKLFIRQSFIHSPNYGLRWHIERVKMMEEMWESICARARVKSI
jgi:hypothetical protein